MKKTRKLQAVILIFILLCSLVLASGCENTKIETATNGTVENTTENETEELTEKRPDPYFTDFPENEDEMLQKWEEVIVKRNVEIESMRMVHSNKLFYSESDGNSEYDQTFTDQDKINYIIELLDSNEIEFEKVTTEGDESYMEFLDNDYFGIIGKYTFNYFGIVINLSDEDQNMILGVTVDLDGYIQICTPTSFGYVYKSTEPISFDVFNNRFNKLCMPHEYKPEIETN